jgi:hypothetical protein
LVQQPRSQSGVQLLCAGIVHALVGVSSSVLQ